VVEDRLLTSVGGTIGASVLSTPGMIGMMEGSATALAYEHLPDGQATVGFEVCVKHVAAATAGATCRPPRLATSPRLSGHHGGESKDLTPL
jgi:fluoroacetyl-CoA thioesterase